MVPAKAAEKDGSQHKGSQASVAAPEPRDESAWSMTSSQRRTQTRRHDRAARRACERPFSGVGASQTNWTT